MTIMYVFTVWTHQRYERHRQQHSGILSTIDFPLLKIKCHKIGSNIFKKIAFDLILQVSKCHLRDLLILPVIRSF